jgi:hypothetical protein
MPRAVAKQMEKIGSSMEVVAILHSMRQNKSAQIQSVGALALSKAIVTGQA